MTINLILNEGALGSDASLGLIIHKILFTVKILGVYKPLEQFGNNILRLFAIIKTYTLPHHLQLGDLFSRYKMLLNAHILAIWTQIRWTSVAIQKRQKPHSLNIHLPYKQRRMLPTLPEKFAFDKSIRAEYLRTWPYAAHWVNSAMSTAWSILHSWSNNYKQGHRKRSMPVVKRDFMRIKQTLMKWDGKDQLRITIHPYEWEYVNLSHRYFPLGIKLGEPVITPTVIHLPFHYPDPPREGIRIAWDSNFHSLDGFSPETGWIKLDLKPLHTLHDTYHDKYRHLNQIYARNKHRGKILYAKYHRRERNRVTQYLHRVAKCVAAQGTVHGFEALQKGRMVTRRHTHNRKLSDTDWRKIMQYVALHALVTNIMPYYSSKTCARCGYLKKDLKGDRVFCCPRCGHVIDRQWNAAIVLYQRMNGVARDPGWLDAIIQRNGEMPAIGAETSLPNELVREGNDLRMPKQNLRVPLKCNG